MPKGLYFSRGSGMTRSIQVFSMALWRAGTRATVSEAISQIWS